MYVFNFLSNKQPQTCPTSTSLSSLTGGLIIATITRSQESMIALYSKNNFQPLLVNFLFHLKDNGEKIHNLKCLVTRKISF